MPAKDMYSSFLLDASLFLVLCEHPIEAFSIPPDPKVGVEQGIPPSNLHRWPGFKIVLHHSSTIIGEAYHPSLASLAFPDPQDELLQVYVL